MSTSSKTIVLFSFFILSMFCCHAEAIFFPKLVVNGSAVLQKPADQLTLSISVVTQGATAEQALGDNNVLIHDVVDSLQLVGLEKGEYTTGQFAIQPIYSLPPKNPPSDWRAAIIAYEVTNNLHIRTQKLELAPHILDAAGRSGATQISNISFGIKDHQTHRSEAISQATSNALQDAESLAEAAHIKLLRVLDIKLDQANMHVRSGPNMLFMAKAAHAPFIEAPDVEIQANVSVTFEICPG